jgi:hypothetical protein
VIPPDKLTRYALDPTHVKDGVHKARVFQAVLGITAADSDYLASAILAELPRTPATPKGHTLTGEEKFEVTMQITGRNGKTHPVITAWRMTGDPAGGDGTPCPCLITTYINPKG